jgi:hypothetical protein
MLHVVFHIVFIAKENKVIRVFHQLLERNTWITRGFQVLGFSMSLTNPDNPNGLDVVWQNIPHIRDLYVVCCIS